MKNIVVTFECTKNQKEKLKAAAGDNKLIFSKEIKDANIVIGELDLDKIREASNLEWIQMTWAGTDKYTANEGFPKNVRLSNASGAFGPIISEYILGAILTKYRHFEKYFEQQKDSIWQDVGTEDSLYGKKVLFIGTGDICTNTANRLKAFGTFNTGLNRHGENKNDTYVGFDKIDLIKNVDIFLQDADIVISAVPNKPETRHLLSKDRLLKMKKHATLVNVGRGTLLDVDELNEVLDMGHLKYVILDVTNPEPLPQNHPLWKKENVLITPHISGKSIGHSQDTQNRIVELCTKNLSRYLSGDALLHEIKESDFE